MISDISMVYLVLMAGVNGFVLGYCFCKMY